MAQVTTRKLVEGPTGLVLRVDFAGDGTEELENEVILSPEDLEVVPNPKNIPAFRLMQAWYSMIWFDTVLKVGTVTPQVIWPLARDNGNYIDFRSFGGLVDSDIFVPGLPVTDGKLTVSTNDLILGSIGTLILDLQLTDAAAS